MMQNNTTPKIDIDTVSEQVPTHSDDAISTDHASLIKENKPFVNGLKNNRSSMSVQLRYLQKKKQRGLLFFYIGVMLVLWSVVLWFWYSLVF